MRPLVGLALLPGLALAQNWQELGPSPIAGGFTGRVSALAVSHVDPNKYYVGGADGGVWLTTNGGTTWKPLTDQQATSAVGAVALDPTNDNIVYVGTGEANYANHSRYGLGLLKSTDGGKTWALLGQSVFAGRTFSKIVIDPNSPQTIYAAIAAAGGFPELVAAKGHPLANGPLGVFKSTDGGQTWAHVTGVPQEACTDIALVPGSPNVLFAAIGRPFGSGSNGIYRSINGGATWSKLGGGLPTANVGRISVATSASDPNRVYALFVRNADSSGGGASTLGGYRSDNQGDTWTSVPVGSFQSSYGWFLCAVGVKPTNPDVAVFAGLSLIRTSNAGGSFSTITTPHVDHHAIAWDANGRLVVGSDGGVFRSTNDGTSWTNLNTGLGICQFYAALSIHPDDPNVFIGGLQDNGTVVRNSQTRTWGNYIGGDGGYTALDQLLPSRAFAQFQGSGNLYRTSNGGSSWSSSGSGISTSDRNAFFSPIEIDPTTSNRILAATYRIYRSTNGGTSWTAISGDVSNGNGSVRALAIAPSNPQVVWAATNDGNVSKSVDGGATWTKMLQGIPGWPRVTRELWIDPQDAQTVYLAVARFGLDQVRRTKNGGTTWQTLDGDLPDIPVNCVATYGSAIIAGTDDGVWWSVNDGAHWSRLATGLPRACVIDIKIDLVRRRLVAGTQGRGAWCLALPAPPGKQGS